MIFDQQIVQEIPSEDLPDCPPLLSAPFTLGGRGKAETHIIAQLYEQNMIFKQSLPFQGGQRGEQCVYFKLTFSFQLSFQLLRKNINNKDKWSIQDVYGIRFAREEHQVEVRWAGQEGEGVGEWRRQLGLRLNHRGFHEAFQHIREIGSGAFAFVHLVRSLEDGKHYAVKAFPKESVYAQENGARSLQNQIQIMRRVSHKNLMRLVEVYESKNSIYICLELLSGGSLHDRISNKYKFSAGEVRAVMRGVLQGLQAMHHLDYMHRDIKPENILFRDTTNDCVIADFGLAESAAKKELMFPRCGTPGYVAPEIANLKTNAAYSTACDLFSLGVVFHLMILGKAPFNAPTNDGIMELNKQCKINFQKFEYNQLPPTWLSLLKGLLEKDPSKRLTASEALGHQFFKKEPLVTRNIDKPTFRSCQDSPKGKAVEESPPAMLSKDGGRKGRLLREGSCLKFKMRENLLLNKAEQEMSPVGKQRVPGKYGESRFRQMADHNS